MAEIIAFFARITDQRHHRKWFGSILLSISLLLNGCDQPWNSPNSNQDKQQKIYYTSFSLPPKHLDPAKSYSSDEFILIENIYEPPLQYNYLKRPYQLEPLAATKMPKVSEVQQNGTTYFVYDIHIKQTLFYAPHPALGDKRQVSAADFVYQIKRLADPSILSPIARTMGEYIVGFNDFAKTIKESQLPLHEVEMAGVKQLSKFHYQIWLKQAYPQFRYWLAMPFFAPMPQALIAWHNSDERPDDHLGIDWYPHGSGAFMMLENNPNYRFVLAKNPNYHEQYYPDGSESRRLPLLDKVIFNLEKEAIPYWHKFLQGYYDASGVSSDNFDQAIQLSSSGEFALSEDFVGRDLQLKSIVAPTIYYMGFNMLDETVGGYSEKKQKLRQAISIAINLDEYISIFANGRAIIAQGPIPPGIFGYQHGKAGINPYVFSWQDDKAVRHPLSKAKQLLKEAGYENGIDPKTGKPLVLNYDTVGSSGDSRANLEWYRRQFQKLNIQLNLRLTDYNRFQDKVKNGQAQIFSWGWNADYPDPENFLFLLLGSNAKVDSGGVNAINYNNPEFNALFKQMKNLPNSPQRQQIINRMVAILQQDAPWNWGFFPKAVGLYHQWVDNVHPIPITKKTFKYRDIDILVRQQKQQQWNQPRLMPLMLLALLLLTLLTLVYRRIKRAQNQRLR